MKPRVVCVGGGITGAFAAYWLTKGGARVTIVDRDGIGQGTSAHNAGGLNPLHGAGVTGAAGDLALTSFRMHVENWEEIRRLSGVAFGCRITSRIHLALDPDDLRELASIQALHDATPGFTAQSLSPEALRALDPRLTAEAIGGLSCEGSGWVEAGRYVSAVSAAAVKLGAEVVRAEVCGLREQGGRVTAVVLANQELECDGVVIATGAWCREPAAWLGTSLPVEPLKGQMLLAIVESQVAPHEVTSVAPHEVTSVAPHEVTSVAPHEVTWRAFGVYPAGQDRVWLGGTEERAGLDAGPTPAARTAILKGIRRLLPGAGAMRVVGQVAGLRPATPDGLPIVGIPKGWENVCVATGAGRKGMLLGAGLGYAAADLILAGATRMPVAACAPERFSADPPPPGSARGGRVGALP